MYTKQMQRIALFVFLCSITTITTYCLQDADEQSHELPQEGFLFPGQMQESYERLQRIEQKLNQAEQELRECKEQVSQAARIDRDRLQLQRPNVQTNRVEKELNDSLLDLGSRAQELGKETQQLKQQTEPWDRLEWVGKKLPLFFMVGGPLAAAFTAFCITEWYNKKYHKKVSRPLVAAVAGLGTATIIWATWFGLQDVASDNRA